jgi:tryptophan synthase beta chain
LFQGFMDEPHIRLIGVEAGGTSNHIGCHAARMIEAKPGVLHGCYSMLLQNDSGQVVDTHSISAGLDYPMIGPQHAALAKANRAHYTCVRDHEALEAFQCLSQTEGIIPALESSHALAYYIAQAKRYHRDDIVVINLSGRGDKDMSHALKHIKQHMEAQACTL